MNKYSTIIVSVARSLGLAILILLLLIVMSSLSHSSPMPARSVAPQAEVVPSPAQLEQSPTWVQCGQLLKSMTPNQQSLSELDISRHSVSQSSEFLEWVMAIIYVESAFNRKATSTAKAHGLMQMTRVAVVDAVSHCGLKPMTDLTRLFDPATNIRYGTCYLNKVLGEAGGDWTRALIAYNGGFRQVTKYDNGESVASETANYVLKVKRARKLCLAGAKHTVGNPVRREYVSN